MLQLSAQLPQSDIWELVLSSPTTFPAPYLLHRHVLKRPGPRHVLHLCFSSSVQHEFGLASFSDGWQTHHLDLTFAFPLHPLYNSGSDLLKTSIRLRYLLIESLQWLFKIKLKLPLWPPLDPCLLTHPLAYDTPQPQAFMYCCCSVMPTSFRP